MFLPGIWRARSNFSRSGPISQEAGMTFPFQESVSNTQANQREICIPNFLRLQLFSFKARVNQRAETQAAVVVRK